MREEDKDKVEKTTVGRSHTHTKDGITYTREVYSEKEDIPSRWMDGLQAFLGVKDKGIYSRKVIRFVARIFYLVYVFGAALLLGYIGVGAILLLLRLYLQAFT